MTNTISVPRELLNISALHLEYSGYTETGKKLRALLAAAPKAEQDNEGPSDAARYGLLRARFDDCKSSQCELMQDFLGLDGEPHETLDTLIDRALLGGEA